MELNPSFWRHRRILITGHTGFKGSWLALWLKSLGAQVYGYALPPSTEPNLHDAANLNEVVSANVGDVRDLARLTRYVQSCEPQVVFHMAAQSLVRRSYAEPVDTYSTNVMGTVNLLEAVRLTPAIEAVVIITSDKCYENKGTARGYRETDPMGGHDPYSSSKGCAELVTSAYRRSFFASPGSTGVASARAGNVIGGGDWSEDRLVPDMLRSFTLGRPVRVRNPQAVRPWQHVLEPLAGYLALAERLSGHERGDFSDAWNFGPRDEDAQRVQHVVETFARYWGDGATWEVDYGPHPREAAFLRLDCSLARNKLDWRPRIGLDAALEWTACWYREVLSEPTRAKRITEMQIQRYEGLLA